MKLIYLTDFGLPTEWAHGIQVMKMCEAFSGQGVEIELVAPRRRNEIKTDSFAYYGVKKIFRLTKLPCLDFCPGNTNSFYFWLRIVSFLLVAKFYFLIKDFDALYARDQIAGLFFNDFILEIHSLPELIKPRHRKVWRKADKLLVLTSFAKERLVKEGIGEDKILVTPDAVDLKDFDISAAKEQLRQELALPLDKKIIMYAGSFYLHDWKGVDILLASAEYFDRDWVLMLAGGEAEEIEMIKEKYGSPNILLVGRKLHQEIPRYLKAADVLILPNKKGKDISEKYTSPLKLFEYMASDRPIVASDLPSIREILNDKNSVLVKPNSPKNLALGIRKLIQDDIFSKRLTGQALRDAQNYTWERRAKKIIEFIK
ncbi:MAG: glycosyltransferase family 4 protein [bacterium]|nr:glycosyltransferase family 4 protein [bacterium]